MLQDEIEIKDVENYRGKSDEKFSHEQLVMSSMRRVIEIGTHELYEGYNEIIEDKHGNRKIIYKENTRQAFIEAVETCEMVLSCDMDKEAENNIQKLKEEMEEKREDALKEQMEWFNNLPFNIKKSYNYIVISPKIFNSNLPQYNQFQSLQIRIYRKIFAELTKLTKRLDFFAGEEFEG
jgi:hypothetical protein